MQEARIGDARRARIGDQRDVFASYHPFDNLFHRPVFVELVMGTESGVYVKMFEQHSAGASVFCQHEVHLLEEPQSAQRDVF